MNKLIEMAINQLVKELKNQPITLAIICILGAAIWHLMSVKAEAAEMQELVVLTQEGVEADIVLMAIVQTSRLDNEISALKSEIRKLKREKVERELDGKAANPMYDDEIGFLGDLINDKEQKKLKLAASEKRQIDSMHAERRRNDWAASNTHLPP